MNSTTVLNLAGLAAWLVAIVAAVVALVAFLVGAPVLVMACAGALSAWMLVVAGVARRALWRR